MSKKHSNQSRQLIELTGAPDTLEVRQIYRKRRRFTGISLIQTASSRSKEPDLLDLLGQLSKSARDLFLEIKRNMSYRTHMAVLPNQELSRGQINKRSQAIRELESAGSGMARRVPTYGITNRDGIEQRYRPSTFIISPDYIFPGPDFEESIQHIWRQCAHRPRRGKGSKRASSSHSSSETSEAPRQQSPEAADLDRPMDFSKLAKHR